jgi:hypothetical protein
MSRMTTPTGNTWPPSREQLEEDLAKVATVGVGRPLRGKAELKALAEVAGALAADKTLPELRQVEDAIRTVIDQLGGGPFARATAWIFWTTDDPALALKGIGDRRDQALDELKCKLDALKKTYEPRMRFVIADALLKRLGSIPRLGALTPEEHDSRSVPPIDNASEEAVSSRDAKSDTESAEPSPPGEEDVLGVLGTKNSPSTPEGTYTGATKASGKFNLALLRRRPLAVVLVVGLAVAALAVGLALSLGGNRALRPTAELKRLAQETERDLTGDQAPVPGTASRVLGFGDPTPGGRTVYPYVVHGKVGTPASPMPTLDVLTDVSFGVGDEREFLHLAVGTTKKPPAIYIAKRTAFLQTGKDLWLSVYIDNGAGPEPNCSQLVGPSIAQDTTARIAIWNSPNRRLHVIRGWLFASNAQPTWVTDAVAVITEGPRTLELIPSLSSQYSQLPARYHRHIPLKNDAILQPAGMRLEDNGLLGSCWQNRVAIFLLFRQR